ncbi:MAG: alpha/beta fold hydrolase [Nocardioidaceae bacterium]
MSGHTEIRLSDGRLLQLWEGGDPAGLPVVFHHGTPNGRLQAVSGDSPARALRVRLISVGRPGYGRSSDSPPSLASVGADTVEVADASGFGEFAVLGASGGGPYALATGLAAPDRVRAVGVAVGIGPWRLIEPTDAQDPDDQNPDTQDPDTQDPDRRLLALADAGDVTGALDGFRAQGHVAFDRMLALDDMAMVDEFFHHAPPKDTPWLDSAARRAWAADLREALRSYDGYARDNVAWGADWDIDPALLKVPTWLWYGERDVMVPVSHGQWLAGRIPGSTLVVRPGKGHGATFFEHWGDMLETLRDQMSRPQR